MKIKRILVYGRVQSVGFRPFVYNLAKKFNLKGFVRNKTTYVEILVEQKPHYTETFISLVKNAPSPIKVDRLVIDELDLEEEFKDFSIIESEDNLEEFLYIPAEIKLCNSCLSELFDVKNRRYLYPFINCTNCGPRFTIINKLPYDRENTTMKMFKMCNACLEEYNDPQNRRFHAQPNACYVCGPGLELKKVEDYKIKNLFKLTKSVDEVKDILEFITKEILNGKIFAIKSYGGYHLICDATNDEAVLRLRKSKYREFKPFAIMASNLDMIEKYCYLNKKEKEILESVYAPIVLLFKKDSLKEDIQQISRYVADKSKYFGFMLPYTPLQFLLFEWLKKYKKDIPLIMTSGNITDEPQVYKDEDAFERLKNIVDYFVSFNREINIRCDDSVVRIYNDDVYFIRRSRGWAPEPLCFYYKFKYKILSFGADLKNTFALAKDNWVVISHHIGDLDNTLALNSYVESLEYYIKTLRFSFEVIACDLHPLYFSSKIAKEFKNKFSVNLLEVQHHYAHMLSCMLENNVFDKCIGIIFDGTGYGLDGKIWGGEFLVGDFKNFKRKAHFDYINLIGADKGIKQPYKTALGFIYEEYKDESLLEDFFVNLEKNDESLKQYKKDIIEGIKFLIENKINLTEVCGVGRIFDIVGVMCGVGIYNEYEGYIPQVLEFFSYDYIEDVQKRDDFYEYIIEKRGESFIVNTRSLLKKIFEDVFFKKVDFKKIASKFHYTLAKISLDIALKIRQELNINNIILSGGVFQNHILLSLLCDLLKKNNFKIYIHRKFPCNDACISVGQLVFANENFKG